MANTTIRSEQIRDGTITDADISLTAGISETKLALDYHTAGLSQTLWTAIRNVQSAADHSLLQNLDYAVAGHTGFAGTDVINTFTHIQAFQSGITSTGLIYADQFQGDGSLLTNIPQGTLDHSALQNLEYSVSGHTGFAGTDVENTFSGIQTFSDGITSTKLSTFTAGITCSSPIIFTGIPSYEGERPQRNIVLTAAGGIPATTNGPAQTKVAGTNFEYYVLDYDATTNETAYWNLSVPQNYADDSDIAVKIFWKESTSQSNANVIWKLGILTRDEDDTWDSPLSYFSLDASNTKNDNTKVAVATGHFTLGSGKQNNDLIIGIQRDAVNDTYTADARFLKAVILYDIKN